jgi:hypothetical protein
MVMLVMGLMISMVVLVVVACSVQGEWTPVGVVWVSMRRSSEEARQTGRESLLKQREQAHE